MREPAFQRVEELFHQAVERPQGERAAFLDSACGRDAALRAAVQQLLDHDAAADAGFLASPIARPVIASEALTLPASQAPASQAPAIPGYEIVDEIGRGGMGVVYKARQLQLHRLVALKMLLPWAPAGLEPLVRFRKEAEVLARLHHTNIVPIYDIGEHEGRPFFTMEYVAGPNLARFLDGRAQEPAASARLIETLARAMHAAHQQGVVHRDLKPANVLLARPAENGAATLTLTACEPRITDFGLAKDTTASGGLTQTGAAMGTPRYMAPEQARGESKRIGPATDVYALGAILYEMLTGRPPFDGETPAATVGQVVHDDPPWPSRLRPRLPRDLVTICMKCLEKSPRRRYASALELAEELRCFRAGEPILARRAGALERAYRWCVRRPLVASLLALLGVIMTAFVVTVIAYEVRLQDALQRKLSAEEAVAAEERRQIIHLDVTIGVMQQNDGDVFTALLYFTEALHLDDGSPDHDPGHRARIAAALRQCPRLVRLLTFDKPIVRASLGPSGGWVALTGDDGEVEFRNVATGERIETAPADALARDREARLTLSPNGALAVGGDAAGGARIWETATGRPVAPPLRHGGALKAAAFRQNGKQVVIVGGDGVVCTWELSAAPEAYEDRPTEELTALAQVMACARLDGQERRPLDPAGLKAAWDKVRHEP